MPTVYFVRHGETDWNVEGRLQGSTDTLLNSKGIAQANLIANRLVSEPGFSAIYSSPLRRAYVTGEIIGARLGLSPQADARLTERGLGEFEGLTSQDVAVRFPDFHRSWRSGERRVPFPGEESPLRFRERIAEFLSELPSRHPDGKIIVITHGGTMGMIMAIVMRLDLERRFPFWFDNASLNIVEFGGAVPRILALNDICHLREGFPHPTAEQEDVQDQKTATADSQSILQSAV